MKHNCQIVKDLLPLYAEKLTSAESNTMIEEHLKECENCKKTFKRLDSAEVKMSFNTESDQMFQNYVKARNKKAKRNSLIIVIIGIAAVFFFNSIPDITSQIMGMTGLTNSEIYVYDNVKNYNKYIGKDAEILFNNKWNMDESIFPEKITKEMNVNDFKMVYYDPWDSQWLSYLVVDYNDDDYKKELERLHAYKSTEYKGYYGAKGFDEKYDLAAMEADSYYGFVYALDAHDGKIIYVEMIFCNYEMDLYYPDYIPEDYLPKGFDATAQNPYLKKNI